MRIASRANSGETRTEAFGSSDLAGHDRRERLQDRLRQREAFRGFLGQRARGAIPPPSGFRWPSDLKSLASSGRWWLHKKPAAPRLLWHRLAAPGCRQSSPATWPSFAGRGTASLRITGTTAGTATDSRRTYGWRRRFDLPAWFENSSSCRRAA